MNNDLKQAKKLIAECQKNKDTYLELGNCGITDLNDLPELFECTHLETLIISEEWFDLKKDKLVNSNNNGDKNKLSAIPSSLSQLKNLKRLILRDNNISDINALSGLTNLQELSLGKNKISDIGVLSDLTGLQILYLGENKIADIGVLSGLTTLQELSLAKNKISDIGVLSGLTNLQTLYLGENKISDIGVLSGLTSLQELSLAKNKISDIGILSGLTSLQELSLAKNKISDIGILSGLTGLQRLYLGENKISDIGVLGDLMDLQLLVLDSNGISDIGALSGLTSLQVLSLAKNKISDIGVLSGLTSLQELYLSENKIADIGVLSDLMDLQLLALYSNDLSDIGVLSGLTNLQTLYLEKNKISDIHALDNLTNLKTLDISNNNINKIPQSLFKLNLPITFEPYDWDDKLSLYGNPIESPPIEIIKQGNKTALNYFKELEYQKSGYLYEAKMLIVGEGGAGKTSLVRRLIDRNADLPEESETTKGIEILQKTFKTEENKAFTINMWDFGGQEIYHSTHQFFLTKRSLYVLVDDTRKDDTSQHDASFQYWLQTVELFGETSPLLIVLNKKGNRSKDIDLKSMQGQFDFIKGRYQINLQSCSGLDQLENAIKHYIQGLPHVGQKLPSQWIAIRKDLIGLAKTKAYISWDKYFDICKKHKIEEKQRAKSLSRYLHDLGTFLHFHDDPLLNKTIFLQNEWVTKAVYKLLDNEQIKAKKGLFCKNDALHVWQDGYGEMHDELLALLLNFELCSHITDSQDDEYLIPNLLPQSQPSFEWDHNNNLQLRYKYEFMPKGLLGRLIVRTHRYLKDTDNAWKNGVLLEKNRAFALVQEIYSQNEIAIKVRGTHQKQLITIIAEELDKINNSFAGIKVQKLIPCNCKECCESSSPHFYRYKSILKRIDKGKMTIECYKSYEDIAVIKLLDNFFDEVDYTPSKRMGSLFKSNSENTFESRTERRLDNLLNNREKKSSDTKNKHKKIFISYSHTNNKYLQRLETHLAPLRRDGMVDDWNDTKFELGDHWNNIIEKKLRESDIVILLISADFISSDFINNVELPIVTEMDKSGNCKIMPIIVENCDWQSHQAFSHVQAYPYEESDQKKRKIIPIGNSQYPENSYVQIVKAIRQYINDN